MPGPFAIPPLITLAPGTTTASLATQFNSSFDYIVKYATAASALENANANNDECTPEFIAEMIEQGVYLSGNSNSLENFWNIIHNGPNPEHLTPESLLKGISKTYYESNPDVIATLLRLTKNTTTGTERLFPSLKALYVAIKANQPPNFTKFANLASVSQWMSVKGQKNFYTQGTDGTAGDLITISKLWSSIKLRLEYVAAAANRKKTTPLPAQCGDGVNASIDLSTLAADATTAVDSSLVITFLLTALGPITAEQMDLVLAALAAGTDRPQALLDATDLALSQILALAVPELTIKAAPEGPLIPNVPRTIGSYVGSSVDSAIKMLKQLSGIAFTGNAFYNAFKSAFVFNSFIYANAYTDTSEPNASLKLNASNLLQLVDFIDTASYTVTGAGATATYRFTGLENYNFRYNEALPTGTGATPSAYSAVLFVLKTIGIADAAAFNATNAKLISGVVTGEPITATVSLLKLRALDFENIFPNNFIKSLSLGTRLLGLKPVTFNTLGKASNDVTPISDLLVNSDTAEALYTELFENSRYAGQPDRPMSKYASVVLNTDIPVLGAVVEANKPTDETRYRAAIGRLVVSFAGTATVTVPLSFGAVSFTHDVLGTKLVSPVNYIDTVSQLFTMNADTNLVSTKIGGTEFAVLPSNVAAFVFKGVNLTAFYRSLLVTKGVLAVNMATQLRLAAAANLPNAADIATSSIVLDGFVHAGTTSIPIEEVLLFKPQPWMNGLTPARIIMHMITQGKNTYNQTKYATALLNFAKTGLAAGTTKAAIALATKLDGTHEMRTESMKVMRDALYSATFTDAQRIDVLHQLLQLASTRADYTVLSLLLIDDDKDNELFHLKALLTRVRPSSISSLKNLFIDSDNNAIYNIEQLTNGLHDDQPLQALADNTTINAQINSSTIWPILFSDKVSFFVSANDGAGLNAALTDAPFINPAILFSFVRKVTLFDAATGKKGGDEEEMIFPRDVVRAAYATVYPEADLNRILKDGNKGVTAN
jgi:hypothetical protein